MKSTKLSIKVLLIVFALMTFNLFAKDFLEIDSTEYTTKLNRNFRYDFNNDGIKDKLVCNDQDKTVSIFDGKNTRNKIYFWELPSDLLYKYHGGIKSPYTLTGCSATKIDGVNMSVVTSGAYYNSTHGVRIPGPQYYFVNKGTLQNGNLNFSARKIYIRENNLNKFYIAQARSVVCADYPNKLVDQGYNRGGLCFYSSYDGPNNTYGTGTASALLKFELDQNSQSNIKDLTKSSGLPWRGGAMGSNINWFPTSKGKYQHLSTMDGALLDFDNNGIIDLVVVSQHSKVLTAKAVFDKNKKEGLRFNISYLSDTGMGKMSEFLRVTDSLELNPNITKKCIYLSGEYSGNDNGDVIDHIRCYQDGAWKTYKFPHDFSSGMRKPHITQLGQFNEDLIFKTNSNNGALKQYKLKSINNVKGWLGKVIKQDNGIRVVGWACQEGIDSSIPIHVYLGNPDQDSEAINITNRWANNDSEDAVKNACKGDGAYRFDFVIHKSDLRKHIGKKIYIRGIKVDSSGPGENNIINGSGNHSVPEFDFYGEIKGWIRSVIKGKKGLRMIGWACQEGIATSIPIHVYVKSSEEIKLTREWTNKISSDSVKSACNADGAFQFNFLIPKDQLVDHVGKIIFIRGIKVDKNAGTDGNREINSSEEFTIPEF